MNEELKRELEENGASVKATIKRFMGNEALYMKFLVRFPDDGNYAGIEEQMKAKNYEEVFKYAHTLKGVTANLGLDPVHDITGELVELVRGRKNEEVDGEKAQELADALRTEYRRFCDIILNNL